MIVALLRPKRTRIRLLAALLLSALAGWSPAKSDPLLPALLSNHAVLQRSRSTNVWGEADVGEHIKVTISDVSADTVADSKGHWSVRLNLTMIGDGPFDLRVEGKKTLTVRDVVIGEVWVGSGQSNMELPLKNTMNAKDEIAQSADSMLRQFRVAKSGTPEPQQNCEGQWVLAEPSTTGDFSAVGYYFCKHLRRALGKPSGLIFSAWGGTALEPWVSREALESSPALAQGAKYFRELALKSPALRQRYVAEFGTWVKKYRREDRLPIEPDGFALTDLTRKGWKRIALPGKARDAGLPDAGAVWFQRLVSIPDELSGQPFYLHLGAPSGFLAVYWNGELAGRFDQLTASGNPYETYIYGPKVKAGSNILSVRIYGPAGGLGISGDLIARCAVPINLSGEWMGHAEYEMPGCSALMLSEYPEPPPRILLEQGAPAYLFNGMISPLINSTIAGVIWYQGENNANSGRSFEYRTSFLTLIGDWRHQWQKELPFYFCQLAGFKAITHRPQESAWAELRESQTKALTLPNTGEAILIDLGEESNIHPKDKKSVGDRLALLALAKTYGLKIDSSGPVYESMRIDAGRIQIRFSNGSDRLVAKTLPARYLPDSALSNPKQLVRNSPNSELEGFAVCGSNREWVWAEAKIVGNTVVVWSPLVSEPVAVRYAWADDPMCNLYNSSGLPAGPFRTDDFPLETEGKSYSTLSKSAQ